MLKIYGIKNCDSMKKAFQLLTQLGVSYEFHDYKKQGIDAQTLQNWFNHVGTELILNKKGTTWRKLSPEQQQFALKNDAQLIETLIANSSLIKRPVIEFKDQYVVGFDPIAIEKLVHSLPNLGTT